MDTLPKNVTVEQLKHRGFALYTKPGISLEADAKARAASQTEGYFLLTKVKPETDRYAEEWSFNEGPFSPPSWDAESTDDDYTEPDDIIYSATVPCGRCGEVHIT